MNKEELKKRGKELADSYYQTFGQGACMVGFNYAVDILWPEIERLELELTQMYNAQKKLHYTNINLNLALKVAEQALEEIKE